MARVEYKGTAGGVLLDRAGNARSGVTITHTGTAPFAASTGATAYGGALTTNVDGEVPGWLDPGVYTTLDPTTGKSVTFEVGGATTTTNEPTTNEKAALAGNSGSPSVTNRFLTEAAMNAVLHQSGVYGSRPPASTALNGTRYFATDKFMEWSCVGAAWVLTAVIAPKVTALPASPVDQQECDFQTAAMAALTPPLIWRLRYDSVSAKWVPVGLAPPLLSVVDPYTSLSAPDRTVTLTTYTTLATAGPVVTLPAIGWYDITLSYSVYHSVAGAQTAMSYDIGATGALDVDAASHQAAASNVDAQRVTLEYRKQFTTAAVLTSKYRTSSGTATFRGSRILKALPVLLG